MENLITPELLDAISWVESRNNPKAVSPVGARGAYQFMPIGWKDVQQSYPDMGIYDYNTYAENPTISRMFAQKLLELNAKRLKDKANLDNLLASYNFGIGGVLSGKKLPEETVNYINKVKTELKPKKKAVGK